jgi:hypothetical protein
VDESKPAQNTPATGQSPPASSPATGGQQAPAESPVAGVQASQASADPGFRERGSLRRRLRFLRKARELAYRDLGGLIFEMHRLGQRRDDLVSGKLGTLERIDSELRAIETALHERRAVTVLREAGVTACARCAAIHSSEDRFCPACGFSMVPHAERPIAATAVGSPAATTAAAPNVPSPTPVSAPTPAPVPATSTSAGAAAPDAPAPVTSLRPVSTQQPAPAPRPAPREDDQPTQSIEPPTQIVRPSAGEPGEKSNRA